MIVPASNSWPEPNATPRRLKAFGERYGVDALYTDAGEMLRNESLDIVAVATNVKGRADLTCLAVESRREGHSNREAYRAHAR